jgi:hypothetical protein
MYAYAGSGVMSRNGRLFQNILARLLSISGMGDGVSSIIGPVVRGNSADEDGFGVLNNLLLHDNTVMMDVITKHNKSPATWPPLHDRRQ